MQLLLPMLVAIIFSFSFHRAKAFLLALSLLSAIFLGLQPNRAMAGTPTFPTAQGFGNSAFSTSVAAGDLNGDGGLDLVVGNHPSVLKNGENWIHLQDQAGNLQAGIAFGRNTEETLAVAVGDLNGDGALDVVVGNAPRPDFNESGQNQIYFNDGTGKVSDGVAFDGAERTTSLVLADFNGDGAIDIVVGNGAQPGINNGGQNRIYYNDGFGNFPTSAAIGAPGDTRALAVADFNRDGWLDLVVGRFEQTKERYFNDKRGNLVFHDNFGNALDRTVSLAVADFTGDGWLDVAAGHIGQRNQLYRNDQLGNLNPGVAFGGLDTAWSMAAGDLNGDGAFDLVIGQRIFQPSRIFLNNGTGGFDNGFVFGDDQERSGLILADMNNDGLLDIISANDGPQNQIYFNQGGGGVRNARTVNIPADRISSVASGDFNRDGFLDIVIGTSDPKGTTDTRDQIYLNDQAGGWRAGSSFGDRRDTYSVAVGDLNGDHALDVVTAHSDQNYIFLNDGAGNFNSGYPVSADRDWTHSIALADLNGDGALDIIAGNHALPATNDRGRNKFYLNDGTGHFGTAIPFGADSGQTRSLALGDLNGDGLVDIITGNYGQPNQIFVNQGGGRLSDGISFGGNENTLSVALGDFDSNGALDVVVGNTGQQGQIFFNDGTGRLKTGVPFGNVSYVWGVAVGDLNNDGALDIITGNSIQPNQFYLNDRFGHFSSGIDFGDRLDPTWAVTTGDFDADGALDIVTGQSIKFQYYPNGFQSRTGNNNNLPILSINHPSPTAKANFFASPIVIESQIISLTYAVQDPESDPLGSVAFFFSLDGGGQWQPAIATTRTVTSNLPASPTGRTYVYEWDTFASGLFGQSDNVVLRLVGYRQPKGVTATGSYKYVHGSAGSFQWPSIATITFPFRVRGTQIQVVKAAANGKIGGVADAFVYRLSQGNNSGLAEPLTSGNGQAPYRTDPNGYLKGRGALRKGDQLVALAPISATQSYTYYQTSAPVSTIGLTMTTVTHPGIQQLMVTTTQPLLLFNLVVALEWDARQETTYLAQLEADLRKSSQVLYDLTNGQAALGAIHLYHDKGFWGLANIAIQADNRQRPGAILGGIVVTPTNDIGANGIITDAYIPGQVRMPPLWNRFGEVDGIIGEDWPRVLAHELGHYLFFLPDNYLGIKNNDTLSLIDCKGSAMSDPYDSGYSEFLTREAWQGDCLQTLAAIYLNRTDWETIRRFYPMLSEQPINPGPSNLPLAVTEITTFVPPTPTLGVADPFFKLQQESGAPLLIQSGRAWAYLRKTQQSTDPTDDSIISLGTPVGDKVQSRGAAPGDELCIINYSVTPLQTGCIVVGAFPTPVTLESRPGWDPRLTITAISSTTIAVTVTNVTTSNLMIQLLPALGHASPELPMIGAPATGFTQIITAADGAYYGYVRLWVPGGKIRQEMLFAFALKSDWRGQAWAWGGQRYNWGGQAWAWGGQRYNWGGQAWAWGGQAWAWGAPIMSNDGQVSLFSLADPFQRTGDLSLQQLARAPALPEWLTLVGQAYQLTVDGSLPHSAILFHYLVRDLPNNDESYLQIYYSPDQGVNWQPLPTELDSIHNHASATAPGAGIYALIATIDQPLVAELNNIGYPIQQPQPITTALASIAGYYTSVCHYHKTEAVLWSCFYPTVEVPFKRLVNTLENFEYPQAYWIYATQPITLYWDMTPAVQPDERSIAAEHSNIPIAPPATYYGWITPSAHFTPTVNTPVVAYIDGVVCGTSFVQPLQGQLAYVIQVSAKGDTTDTEHCGERGKTVVFTVGNNQMVQTASWSNRQAWLQSLSDQATSYSSFSYLPLVLR
ncbi:MAG: VCBS repeat-containing protein [Caldilinea sp. CFX5]|nr:VCBS repeat-containing protein [Caldilinea sp. CFX5]